VNETNFSVSVTHHKKNNSMTYEERKTAKLNARTGTVKHKCIMLCS